MMEILTQVTNSIQFSNSQSIMNQWQQDMTRKSAVAVIFMISEGKICLVLTKRSTKVRSHKGQIGFAGGRFEKGDKSPKDTAARELYEELGIERDYLEFHGYAPVQTALDGSPVYPVIFSIKEQSIQFLPNEDEVAEVLIKPWEKFQAINAKKFEFNYFGVWRSSIIFETSTHNIWGLTAVILKNLNLMPL